VLYRLADGAVRSGDFSGAEAYLKSFASYHARSNERLRALSLDLRANIRFRQGFYDSAIAFAQQALKIATTLEERSLMARHAATSLRAAAEAGNLSRYAIDRRILVSLGILGPIDAVQTATADAMRDLCLERFQDAAAHLASIDVTGVPAELRRELDGYRALAALGRQDMAAARSHARSALEAVPGGWRATSDRRALRRARLLAGFVMRCSPGSSQTWPANRASPGPCMPPREVPVPFRSCRHGNSRSLVSWWADCGRRRSRTTWASRRPRSRRSCNVSTGV
jgi:hypothetical protein